MSAVSIGVRAITYLESLVVGQDDPGRIVHLTWTAKYDFEPHQWHAECYLKTDHRDILDKMKFASGELLLFDGWSSMDACKVRAGYCKHCACGVRHPPYTFFRVAPDLEIPRP